MFKPGKGETPAPKKKITVKKDISEGKNLPQEGRMLLCAPFPGGEDKTVRRMNRLRVHCLLIVMA